MMIQTETVIKRKGQSLEMVFNQAPNKVVDEEDWEQDCYSLHTIWHDYD